MQNVVFLVQKVNLTILLGIWMYFYVCKAFCFLFEVRLDLVCVVERKVYRCKKVVREKNMLFYREEREYVPIKREYLLF